MIRQLTETEVKNLSNALNQLYNIVYQDTYQMDTNDHFERMLLACYQLDLSPVTLVAQAEEALVGVLFGYDFVAESWWAHQIKEYLPAGIDWYRRSFELNELFVRSDYRARGIGKDLLEYLIDHYNYEYILLCVREDNLPAIRLYESLNFKTFASKVNLEYYDQIYFNLMALDLT